MLNQRRSERLKKLRAKTTSHDNMCKPKESEKRVLASETIFHSSVQARDVTSSVINFETPVNISDISILSPSMYSTSTNGGIIIGGTEPGQIQITFQCNNVDEEYAAANVELGVFNYDAKKNTQFVCENEIWTNRLIVIAKFSVLTIVVFGTLKDPNAKFLQKIEPSTINFPPLAEGPIDMSSIVSISDSVMENIQAEINQQLDQFAGFRQAYQ
uniref:Protein virilizer n=1 Tax=Schizaphis graminum TaxID=13262 RepID=A0A2S2PHY4_SCHGA